MKDSQYPEIAALLKSSAAEPRKVHFEHLCKSVGVFEDALSLAKEKEDICQHQIEATLKNASGGIKVVIEG